MGFRVNKSVYILRCWRSCPFYLHEDGERACDHPKAPDGGFIIPNNINDIDFPERCPLRRENGHHTNVEK